MKTKLLITLLSFLVFTPSFGQNNLIKNGSFEDLNQRFPKGWYSLGSPDYYRDGGLVKDFRKDKTEFQSAFDGRNYVGIAAYQFSSEVLFCKLSKPLKKGHIYSISIQVFCPKKRPSARVPEISVYISKEVMRLKGHFWCREVVDYTPLQNDKFEILDDGEWIEVTGEFTAKGGEQFFSIGNFVGVNIEYIGKGNAERKRPAKDFPDVYNYFYDAVSLIEIDSLVNLQINKPIIIEDIYFTFGKSDLVSDSFESLDNLFYRLEKRKDVTIEIYGHTDNVGDDFSNQKLSEQRAKAVADYLQSKGIQKENIRYFGMGESRPITDNKTKNGRQQNRRVEFKLIPTSPNGQ